MNNNFIYNFRGLLSKFIVLCAALILCTSVCYDSFASSELLKKNTTAKIYPIKKNIIYSFTLENKTNTTVENAQFWTYAPVKKTATQLCGDIVSSHPYKIMIDPIGNQILCYTFDIFPPHGKKIISITAKLNMSNQSNKMAGSTVASYLNPEPLIETDHPLIKKKASQLVSSDQQKTIKQTLSWVNRHIKYNGYVSKDHGALYALKHKKGDCTEYMSLFQALCRANQIPTRGIGGYVCQENTVLKPSGYHNWAEVYSRSVWQIADPMENKLNETQSAYIAMRIIVKNQEQPLQNHHRFRIDGKGLIARMNGS
ncbi:MAG: transglutaminase domain-containing protein [Desulfobacteraceae bacterium]|nr:transglutaminase domain-containing protein [Desulfobacteraceae bacterium]